MDKRIKIIQNKKAKNGIMPDFTVIYSATPEKERMNTRYEILSTFKKNMRLIVEIHTDLLSLTIEQRKIVFDGMMEDIKKQGLEYRYKKISSGSPSFNNNIFRFLFRNKIDNEQVFFNIDDGLWENREFIKKIPTFGAKYYFYDQKNDPLKTLDEINSGVITENESAFFKYIVFDCTFIGQMGLFANSLTLEDVNSHFSQRIM